MSAASELRARPSHTPLPPARTRPPLQLVPSPRPRPQVRHDGAFAACLSALLVVGVLGVLLLNTAMQQQADRMATQHRLIAQLEIEAQSLRLQVDAAADPRVLSSQARGLRMRPVRRARFVNVRDDGPTRSR